MSEWNDTTAGSSNHGTLSIEALSIGARQAGGGESTSKDAPVGEVVTSLKKASLLIVLQTARSTTAAPPSSPTLSRGNSFRTRLLSDQFPESRKVDPRLDSISSHSGVSSQAAGRRVLAKRCSTAGEGEVLEGVLWKLLDFGLLTMDQGDAPTLVSYHFGLLR